MTDIIFLNIVFNIQICDAISTMADQRSLGDPGIEHNVAELQEHQVWLYRFPRLRKRREHHGDLRPEWIEQDRSGGRFPATAEPHVPDALSDSPNTYIANGGNFCSIEATFRIIPEELASHRVGFYGNHPKYPFDAKSDVVAYYSVELSQKPDESGVHISAESLAVSSGGLSKRTLMFRRSTPSCLISRQAMPGDSALQRGTASYVLDASDVVPLEAFDSLVTGVDSMNKALTALVPGLEIEIRPLGPRG